MCSGIASKKWFYDVMALVVNVLFLSGNVLWKINALVSFSVAYCTGCLLRKEQHCVMVNLLVLFQKK